MADAKFPGNESSCFVAGSFPASLGYGVGVNPDANQPEVIN
jgi:hypothetical protein